MVTFDLVLKIARISYFIVEIKFVSFFMTLVAKLVIFIIFDVGHVLYCDSSPRTYETDLVSVCEEVDAGNLEDGGMWGCYTAKTHYPPMCDDYLLEANHLIQQERDHYGLLNGLTLWVWPSTNKSLCVRYGLCEMDLAFGSWFSMRFSVSRWTSMWPCDVNPSDVYWCVCEECMANHENCTYVLINGVSMLQIDEKFWFFLLNLW